MAEDVLAAARMVNECPSTAHTPARSAAAAPAVVAAAPMADTIPKVTIPVAAMRASLLVVFTRRSGAKAHISQGA
ncbi:hypothetical protein [Streptomyces lydicus]|uniref:hypothetical protein n=1 Tax=Streptomyces lydicus TaxID=47763 RepID=UPI0037231947